MKLSHPIVLSTYLDAQAHLPYADDSSAPTPMSEENGSGILFSNEATSLYDVKFAKITKEETTVAQRITKELNREHQVQLSGES
jgi:hypothetical protein